MELLVVTLARILPGQESDGQIQMRLIVEKLKSVSGAFTARAYKARDKDLTYLLLTTWEDEEAWQQARELYSPLMLLNRSLSGLLASAPEQWLMYYLWGYSRPAVTPLPSSAWLVNIRSDYADYLQQAWIESLRKQVSEPELAFAFLARSLAQEPALSDPTNEDSSIPAPASLLNLLSWANEVEREDFQATPTFQSLKTLLHKAGTVQTFALDLAW